MRRAKYEDCAEPAPARRRSDVQVVRDETR